MRSTLASVPSLTCAGALTLLVLAGCGPKEEAPPSLVVSAEAIEFGSVGLGSEATQTFTLENSGGGEVQILSASLIEGTAAIFDVSRDGDGLLGAGESETVTVVFSPAEQRHYDGRIQVRSDDEANANVYVTLSGDGAPSTLDNDGDGSSPADGDCNDNDPTSYPGAVEECDGRDNDCDGLTPGNERDGDYDGWLVCEGDCDDADRAVYPGAREICDEKDSDCDGTNADHTDTDGDGFAICDDDCDDEEPLVNPGLAEVCDGLDNDCSGDPDDIDRDRDGHSPCGAAGDCDDNDRAAYPVVVDDDGNEAKADGTEEHPYTTVEEALAALDEVCRTIVLKEGEYEVELTWTDGELTIGGEGYDPSLIVVTAPKGSRPFDVAGGASLTLAGFTVLGASANGDGGAARAVGSTLTLDGMVFAENTCSGDGGAVAVSSGVLAVRDTRFVRNVADDDGGAIAALTSGVTVGGSTVEDNTAVRGGGLLLESCSVELYDSALTGNEAADKGGAIDVIGGYYVMLQRLDVSLNSAAGAGGGLSMDDVNDAEFTYVRNNVFADNTAGTVGGGVSVAGGSAAFVFANNTLVGNASSAGGAGVNVGAGDATDLYLWSNIVGWSSGPAGIRSGDVGASVGWNLFYATSSGTDLDVGAGEDAGNNLVENPLFDSYTNDGDPSDDVLDFDNRSPAWRSGPANGEGPAWYSQWENPDGSRNHRGHAGGGGAAE